ncbi:MAG: ABC transporter ATP-binding protein [Chloroflexota bacterium]|nr:ABC transporter ATP-binding protein [Chloroflexota bacterium]
MAVGVARLQLQDICLAFNSNGSMLDVLQAISLDVLPGEFVSALGPSGCGKSSLLKAVAGLIQPTAGVVRVDGQVVRGHDVRVGMVFQEYALFPWLTLRENVEFGLKMRGVPGQTRRGLAARYIDLVRLNGFESHYPQQLSGGMRQRAALARALIVDPEILLMDEPFGALDAQTRISLQVEVERLVGGTQTTVLFVTHAVDEAIYLSDRIVVTTARPARIKEIVSVDLPRPRDRGDPAFAALQARVLRLVREEIESTEEEG